ncbi:hypothetical protein HPB51_029679 [Rhipicephalus microplus]|uniref:HAT C-terminal dimerisation domain-containing protein n=2 Tax=Rhipicephalus TaxID=34630 RepID=A0A9J6CTY0_RHIMP|nr:hypothetical protein HPB51_029679 [Rhipicephalus microplus]
MKRHSATTKQRSLAPYFKKVRTDEADGEEPPPSKDKTSFSSALVESQARPNSVATQEKAPVYMNHLRTNTSRTPMRRREMMVAAVQLQVIFVLQSTLGKVTPLPLGNAQGRYVGHDTSGVPILKEDFVDFVPVYDLTGKALASTILNSLRGHGFDLNLLCGQGYDGAASMSGHLNGVQAFIRQTAPKAFIRVFGNCIFNLYVCESFATEDEPTARQSRRFNTRKKKISSLLLPNKITNVEMALPRITGRQMQRSNVPSATPEEYYRRNVYLPLLADFENQLRDRFDAHKKVVVGLNMLLPKFCASASLSDIDDAVQFYLGDIPSANVIEAEFTLWVNKCCQIEEKNRPACALQALEMCNRDFFPNIHSLLSILATLPVSTSTPERTFSTLRRLKSYLRNHMNNDRLTGLALLSIHRELQVTPEQVLTEFCKLPRRKNFLV